MFVASSLGGLGLTGVTARAQPPDGTEVEPGYPTPPVDSSAPGDPSAPTGDGPTGDPLTVVTNGAPAEPNQVACADAAQSDESTVEAARREYQQGVAHYRKHQIAKAAEAFHRAARLFPDPPTLYAIGKIENEQGHYAAARQAWERFLFCTANQRENLRHVEVDRELLQLRNRTAHLIVDHGLAGTKILIDGKVVTTGVDFLPIYVDAGMHTVEVIAPDGRRMSGQIYVEAGSKFVLTRKLIEDVPVTPHPCLSPPKRDCSNGEPYVALTAGPNLMVQTSSDRRTVFVGGFAGFLINQPISCTLNAEARLFAAPSGSDHSFVMPVGASLSLGLEFNEHFSIATSLAAGYLQTPEPSRSVDGIFEPASSFLLQPELTPLLVRFGQIAVEPRIGLVFSQQHDLDGDRFSLSYVRASIGVSYLFWEPIRWREDY